MNSILLLAGCLLAMGFFALQQRIRHGRLIDIDLAPRQELLLTVDLNSASAAELGVLPGIGPRLAREIVADRNSHGPFGAVDELLRVPGIGEIKLAALREYLVCRIQSTGSAIPDPVH
jgi:competence ComEA-like helix-hairpin-helix protein